MRHTCRKARHRCACPAPDIEDQLMRFRGHRGSEQYWVDSDSIAILRLPEPNAAAE